MFGNNRIGKLQAELKEQQKHPKKKKKERILQLGEILISLTEVLHFILSSRNTPCTCLIKTYVTIKAVISCKKKKKKKLKIEKIGVKQFSRRYCTACSES